MLSVGKRSPSKPLDIEIVPTSIMVPKRYRVALTARGKDYVYSGGPHGRPLGIYGGKTTLHLGGS